MCTDVSGGPVASAIRPDDANRGCLYNEKYLLFYYGYTSGNRFGCLRQFRTNSGKEKSVYIAGADCRVNMEPEKSPESLLSAHKIRRLLRYPEPLVPTYTIRRL